jgi:hypothetical protein
VHDPKEDTVFRGVTEPVIVWKLYLNPNLTPRSIVFLFFHASLVFVKKAQGTTKKHVSFFLALKGISPQPTREQVCHPQVRDPSDCVLLQCLRFKVLLHILPNVCRFISE